jgi:hypothetical protein
MATVNKDFKIKSGLVVEGSSATVGGFNVLTKKQDDQDYIVGLIGGTSTSANTANTVVKRNADGDFAAGTITADIVGTVSSLSNHDTADLAENATNKYFTDARAISATAASYDVIGAAAAAKTAAEATASADATSKANAAQSAAEATAAADATSKANAAKSEAISAAATDATTKANNAATSANSYTDTAISTEVSNRNSAITSAISTEVTNRNSAISTAVSGLVDGAPALLDTLNELAAAIGDSPDTITNLTTSIGNKLPLAGGTLTGALTLSGAPTVDLEAATKKYVDDNAYLADMSARGYADGLAVNYEAAGAAATAEQNAKDYADDLIDDGSNLSTEVWSAYKTSTEIGIAQQAATDVANSLTTDDVAEGTAQYFTDARAKSSAASLLTGATLSNITITGTGAGLTITAENGIADSTTSNLTEGSNLYFTNARAVDALEAVVPNFTAVELNSVAKQVAATLSAPTAGVQTAHAFAKADYRSAEYLVKIANGNHTEISKVLLTLDSTDGIAITEYGIVGTNGSLGTVSAGISGANVQLLVTTANNTSTVTVVGTLLA